MSSFTCHFNSLAKIERFLREDSQIDFTTHNVRWGWGVLRVDVIDLKINFFRNNHWSFDFSQKQYKHCQECTFLLTGNLDIFTVSHNFCSSRFTAHVVHVFKIELLSFSKMWPPYWGYFIFLLTGLRIYTGEYKAQGPTLCPTEGRALRGPRALYSPV